MTPIIQEMKHKAERHLAKIDIPKLSMAELGIFVKALADLNSMDNTAVSGTSANPAPITSEEAVK